MKKFLYLLLALFVACTTQNEQKSDFTRLDGEYLGQDLPGDSAVLFAPGIVSTGLADRDVAIYPDGTEIYFCKNILGFKYATIFYSKLENDKWSKPKVLEFATDPRYIFIEPHISPDGKKIYFASNKQLEGEESGDMEIWVAEREGDKWGEPYNIGFPINTETDQYFPSVTNDGTMYFTSEDETNEEFIFRSKLIDGKYQEPEKLPDHINMRRGRFNAFISPNEDFLIIPAFGMPESFGGADYYIVFRNENDIWSQAMNMGKPVSSEGRFEWSASLSPDGKYLFFMSDRVPQEKEFIQDVNVKTYENVHNSPQNSLSDIYWIKSDFIKELRKKAKF